MVCIGIKGVLAQPNEMSELQVIDVGACPYARALKLQEALVDRAIADETFPPALVLAEHVPPVITLGRSADAGNVLASREALAGAGIEVVSASRGGDVTWHGPGQIVGYPIVRLARRGHDVRQYLRDLEEAILRTAARFGISAARRDGLTGVWVGREKLAAIGVAVRRWVAYHGFALNVSPDLSGFANIVPCGLAGEGVTSMERILDRAVRTAEVKPVLLECLAEVFAFERLVPTEASAFGF